jgi:hypothetical protein
MLIPEMSDQWAMEEALDALRSLIEKIGPNLRDEDRQA